MYSRASGRKYIENNSKIILMLILVHLQEYSTCGPDKLDFHISQCEIWHKPIVSEISCHISHCLHISSIAFISLVSERYITTPTHIIFLQDICTITRSIHLMVILYYGVFSHLFHMHAHNGV